MTSSTPPDLLATIVAATRRIVDMRSARLPQAALERQCHRRPDGPVFERALREGDVPRVIAECKRRSPSRGILRQDYDAAAHARSYQAAGAAAISVLTEPTFFDGDPEHLRAVRQAVDVPILRKDFIVTDYQLVEAVALGADAVLLIVAALTAAELRRFLTRADELGLTCLVEVHHGDEAAIAVEAGARVIGVNSRNLRTLAVDPDVLDTVAARLPAELTTVAESGIRTREDIAHLGAVGYHAFLVGERLISRSDPGAALRELRGEKGGGGRDDECCGEGESVRHPEPRGR